MPLALLLIAIVLLIPVAKLGSKGDAGTVAAAFITALVTVGVASSLA